MHLPCYESPSRGLFRKRHVQMEAKRISCRGIWPAHFGQGGPLARHCVILKVIEAHCSTRPCAFCDENRHRSGTGFPFFTSFGATEKILFGLHLWSSKGAHFACYYQLRSVKSLGFTCQNCKGRSSASFTSDVDKRRSLQSQPDCRSPAVFLCGGKDVYLSFCSIFL